MKYIDKTEWRSGGLMILIGLGTTWRSLDYTVGTLAQMGPGYVPLMLGILLTFVGILILARPGGDSDPASHEKPKKLQLRPWVAIVASMLVFIIVGKYGGLVPATFLLVFISALGDSANSLKASSILAFIMTVSAVVLFHYGMKMQFPLFNWG